MRIARDGFQTKQTLIEWKTMGKNDNNYNVLLNRKYYTEGVIVMLTTCHGAFVHSFSCSVQLFILRGGGQNVQATVAHLDGANGREILGTVSCFCFSR